jgi:hypothetical protein
MPQSDRRCFVCNAPTALALSDPGPMSERKRKGYLPYCSAHEADAFMRRDGRSNPARNHAAQPGHGGSAAVSGPAPKPQGDLFGG